MLLLPRPHLLANANDFLVGRESAALRHVDGRPNQVPEAAGPRPDKVLRERLVVRPCRRARHGLAGEALEVDRNERPRVVALNENRAAFTTTKRLLGAPAEYWVRPALNEGRTGHRGYSGQSSIAL